MTDDTLTPIAAVSTSADRTKPLGRRADFLAAFLAGFGAFISLIAAIWFFAGFAENDTRPEHLSSAFVLTTILFGFAIIPFASVAIFARRAYRKGTYRAHLLWTIFLMLPWIALGVLTMSHTPLPDWTGFIMAVLAAILTLWAFVSLILDRNIPSENTELSHQNDVQDAPE